MDNGHTQMEQYFYSKINILAICNIKINGLKRFTFIELFSNNYCSVQVTQEEQLFWSDKMGYKGPQYIFQVGDTFWLFCPVWRMACYLMGNQILLFGLSEAKVCFRFHCVIKLETNVLNFRAQQCTYSYNHLYSPYSSTKQN